MQVQLIFPTAAAIIVIDLMPFAIVWSSVPILMFFISTQKPSIPIICRTPVQLIVLLLTGLMLWQSFSILSLSNWILLGSGIVFRSAEAGVRNRIFRAASARETGWITKRNSTVHGSIMLIMESCHPFYEASFRTMLLFWLRTATEVVVGSQEGNWM